MFDVLIASVLLILLSPFLVLIAVLIRMTSKGPGIYGQTESVEATKSFGCQNFAVCGLRHLSSLRICCQSLRII